MAVDHPLFAVALALGGGLVLLALPYIVIRALRGVSRGGGLLEYGSMALVVTPLALGFVDVAYGSYGIVFVLAWFGIPRIHRIGHADTLDLLVAAAAAIILVSPYWHGEPSESSRSAALGAALGVAYFLPIKWVVRESADRMLKLARVIAFLGVGLSIFTLSGGVATQVDGTSSTRLFVDFANANYASAALATTASVTLLLASSRLAGAKNTAIVLAALSVQMLAIYQLGSRAALGGVILAIVIVALFTRAPRLARGAVLAVLIGAFVAGWFPRQFADILIVISEPLSQIGSLARSESAVLSASGRLTLWDTTIVAIQQSPLVGWGPGTYAELFNAGAAPAHAWGLEYFASVGVLGAIPLMVVILLAYGGAGSKYAVATNARGDLWKATTAIALVPSLALSTHQWNAWAWMVVALWACSRVLDEDTAKPDFSQSERRTTQTPA